MTLSAASRRLLAWVAANVLLVAALAPSICHGVSIHAPPPGAITAPEGADAPSRLVGSPLQDPGDAAGAIVPHIEQDSCAKPQKPPSAVIPFEGSTRSAVAASASPREPDAAVICRAPPRTLAQSRAPPAP